MNDNVESLKTKMKKVVSMMHASMMAQQQLFHTPANSSLNPRLYSTVSV